MCVVHWFQCWQSGRSYSHIQWHIGTSHLSVLPAALLWFQVQFLTPVHVVTFCLHLWHVNSLQDKLSRECSLIHNPYIYIVCCYECIFLEGDGWLDILDTLCWTTGEFAACWRIAWCSCTALLWHISILAFSRVRLVFICRCSESLRSWIPMNSQCFII